MVLPQKKHYTLADALTWDESERMELIEGVPFMHAAPTRIHQKLGGSIFRQIANYLDGKRCEVYAGPFAVRLFEEKEDTPDTVDTMVEPDISVVCDPDKLDDIGCKGAPDLIVEILSPSTQRHDRMVKFNLYQRAGVKEYWIVDPDMQTVQVHVLEDGQYYSPQVYTAGETVKVHVLEACFVDLKKVFV